MGCTELAPIIRIVGLIVKILQIAAPILLIILVTIDVVRIISGKDEKEMNDAKNKIVKRLIYAIVIFLVPLLVKLALGMVANTISDASSWVQCWNNNL